MGLALHKVGQRGIDLRKDIVLVIPGKEYGRCDDFQRDMVHIHNGLSRKTEVRLAGSGKQVGQAVFENLKERVSRSITLPPFQLDQACGIVRHVHEIDGAVPIRDRIDNSGGDRTLVKPSVRVIVLCQEGDLEAKVWTIPPERMKAKRGQPSALEKAKKALH